MGGLKIKEPLYYHGIPHPMPLFPGVVIVTDAVSAMGLEPGVHNLSAQAIEVKDGRAVIAGTNTLVGR